MIVPVSGLSGIATPATPTSPTSPTNATANQALGAGQSTVGSLGGEGALGVEGASAPEGTLGAGSTSAAEASPAGGASFGNALTEAISSLQTSQQSADSAAQSLAAGTVKDPESAIVTVEDAQLEFDLASQIRNKAAEAAQTIFQTQV